MLETIFLWFWHATVALVISILVCYCYVTVTKGVCRVRRDLTGKTALITGGNIGLGYQTALALAKAGCKVYIGCRKKVPREPDPNDTIQELRNLSHNDQIFFLELDMSKLESVRNFASNFPEENLDFLYNNAGVTTIGRGDQRKITEDNLELVMATNYFGHFLLTNLLLQKIRNVKGRVIMMSSIANLYGEMPDPEDLNYDKNWPSFWPYSLSRVYARSKLCMAIFAKELSERNRHNGLKVASVHPGVANTAIVRDLPNLNHNVAKFFMTYLGKTSIEGAQTNLYLAFCSDDDFKTGHHYADCDISRLVNPMVKDKKIRKSVWAQSAQLVGLR